ncbi:MAG: hypothetical protein ACO36I_19400, partial [Candidatus Latescibacterota bacterium]
AQESIKVSGKVLQLAGNTIYVDVGKNKGWEDGQVLTVFRNKERIGQIKVIRLSNRFCACEAVEGREPVRVGDEVRGDVQVILEPSEKESLMEDNDVAHSVDISDQSGEIPLRVSDDIAELRAIIRGRVSLRYNFLNDQSEANRDAHQPAMLMDWEASQIAGTGLRVNFRVRARRQSAAGSSRAVLRLYDLGLHYESPDNRFIVGVGRLSPTIVSGVGEFDGGLVNLNAGHQVRVGFFGGYQPDYQTSKFNSQTRKAGAFVNWEHLGMGYLRQNTTLAFVGEYEKGQNSREFFYLQNSIWLGRSVSLLQQIAVDLNRNNVSAPRKKIQFRNGYSSLRISPTSYFSVRVGYDARNQFASHLYDSIEDSLVSVAFRQGFQGDVSIRPFRSALLYARGNIRLKAGEESSRAWTVGGSVSNFLYSGLRLRSRYTHIQGAFGLSRDISFGGARYIGRWVYLDGEWGTYQSVMPTIVETRHRLTGRLQVYLPRRTFLNLEHTVYSGIFKHAMTFVELSTRF